MDNKYKSQADHIIKIYEDDEYYKAYFEKNILAKQKMRNKILLLVINFLFYLVYIYYLILFFYSIKNEHY